MRKLDLRSVSNPAWQVVKRERFAAWLFSTYMREPVSCKVVETGDPLALAGLHWLTFTIQDGSCALGMKQPWSHHLGLSALLTLLSDKQNSSIKLSSDSLLNIENPQIKKLQSQIGRESFPTFIATSERFNPPQISGLPLPAWRMCLPLYAHLEEEDLKFPTRAERVSAFLLMPSNSEQGEQRLNTKIYLHRGPQKLVLEKNDMPAENTLKTMLKLGSLEFTLEDFLTLGPGSEISFSLPEQSKVELELAGQVVGRGELVSSEGGYILKLSELSN